MGDMRLKPMSIALISMLLGAVVLALMILPHPLGWSDMDQDGISDLFQDVERKSDMVLSTDGEWKEVEVGHSSRMDITFTLFISGMLLVILPASLFYIAKETPARKRNIEMKRKASCMHDNLRRISSFMSINPSIPNAARLSHVSQFGEGEKILGQILWSSRTRGVPVEKGMKDMAVEDGFDDGIIPQAVEGLISAEGEGSPDDIKRSAENVVERMNSDLKERMSGYSSSLKAPSTALFGIGVLLPVLLATMIPIAGLSIKTVIMIGFFLWVVIPFLIIRISSDLVLKRPLVPEKDQTGSMSPDFGFFSLILFLAGMAGSLIFGSILAGFFSPPVVVEGPFPDGRDSSLLFLLICLSAVISAVTSSLTKNAVEVHKRTEEEAILVPDLLSEMGTQLMEGRSIERSVERGYERIGRAPPLQGRSYPGLEEGPVGRAVNVASDFSRAGGRAGGQAVKALGTHLREVGRLGRSMKQMVRSSVGHMQVTSSVFAPVMVGASVGIFRMMDRSSGLVQEGEIISMGMSRGDLTVTGFILLCGVYLLLLSFSTSIAMRRLEDGVHTGGYSRVPGNMVLTSIMFTFGVVISTLIIGG